MRFLFLLCFYATVFAEESIEELIRAHMNRENIPGVAVAIVQGEKSSLLHFGFADVEKEKKVSDTTLFAIASITKVFTSTELAIEVLRGRVHLNNPLSNWIPEKSLHEMTLLDLATHSSSLPRVIPHENIVTFLEKWKPSYPIGSKYSYSNLGYGVLGMVLEKVEHTSIEELIKRDILIPLNMTSTFFPVPKSLLSHYAEGYAAHGPVPANELPPLGQSSGGMKSTSRDMLQFLQANLGMIGSPQLVHAMKFAQHPRFRVNDQLSLGLGWQVFQKENVTIIDKNGGLPGFSSYIGFIPEKKIGIVILMNQGKANSTALGREALFQLLRLSK